MQHMGLMCWALSTLGQIERGSLDASESQREMEGSRRFKKLLGRQSSGFAALAPCPGILAYLPHPAVLG